MKDDAREGMLASGTLVPVFIIDGVPFVSFAVAYGEQMRLQLDGIVTAHRAWWATKNPFAQPPEKGGNET